MRFIYLQVLLEKRRKFLLLGLCVLTSARRSFHPWPTCAYWLMVFFVFCILSFFPLRTMRPAGAHSAVCVQKNLKTSMTQTYLYKTTEGHQKTIALCFCCKSKTDQQMSSNKMRQNKEKTGQMDPLKPKNNNIKTVTCTRSTSRLRQSPLSTAAP